MAEVRPARGEYVSVVELRTARELEILDLVREPEWPNPFTDDAVNYWVEFAELLAAFAEELSKPLRSRDDLTDYIPSQKRAELIEAARVDGISYPSAMEPSGTNGVLFDPYNILVISWSLFLFITQTEYFQCPDSSNPGSHRFPRIVLSPHRPLRPQRHNFIPALPLAHQCCAKNSARLMSAMVTIPASLPLASTTGMRRKFFSPI